MLLDDLPLTLMLVLMLSLLLILLSLWWIIGPLLLLVRQLIILLLAIIISIYIEVVLKYPDKIFFHVRKLTFNKFQLRHFGQGNYYQPKHG